MQKLYRASHNEQYDQALHVMFAIQALKPHSSAIWKHEISEQTAWSQFNKTRLQPGVRIYLHVQAGIAAARTSGGGSGGVDIYRVGGATGAAGVGGGGRDGDNTRRPPARKKKSYATTALATYSWGKETRKGGVREKFVAAIDTADMVKVSERTVLFSPRASLVGAIHLCSCSWAWGGGGTTRIDLVQMRSGATKVPAVGDERSLDLDRPNLVVGKYVYVNCAFETPRHLACPGAPFGSLTGLPQVWSNGDVMVNSGLRGMSPATLVILNLVLGVFKVEVCQQQNELAARGVCRTSSHAEGPFWHCCVQPWALVPPSILFGAVDPVAVSYTVASRARLVKSLAYIPAAPPIRCTTDLLHVVCLNIDRGE